MPKVRNVSLTLKKQLSEKALANATSLLNEAKILFQNNAFARACFLAITCVEEARKAEFIFGASKKLPGKKRINEIFYDHAKKFRTKHAVIRFSSTLDDQIISEYILPNAPEINEILSIRENSLYVDTDGNHNLVSPENLGLVDATKCINDAESEINSVSSFLHTLRRLRYGLRARLEKTN